MKFESMPSSPDPEQQEEIPQIPDKEFKYTTAKSSGPGGQNVNKRNTKVHMRWHILSSTVFSNEQKLILETALSSRIDTEGCLYVDVGGSRDQQQNIKVAKERVQELVNEALTPVAERKPTEPTGASKRKRRIEKELQSRKKADRRGGWDD